MARRNTPKVLDVQEELDGANEALDKIAELAAEADDAALDRADIIAKLREIRELSEDEDETE